jgi:hypothetical protein
MKNIPHLMKNSKFRDNYFNKLLWNVNSLNLKQMLKEFHSFENIWFSGREIHS